MFCFLLTSSAAGLIVLESTVPVYGIVSFISASFFSLVFGSGRSHYCHFLLRLLLIVLCFVGLVAVVVSDGDILFSLIRREFTLSLRCSVLANRSHPIRSLECYSRLCSDGASACSGVSLQVCTSFPT